MCALELCEKRDRMMLRDDNECHHCEFYDGPDCPDIDDTSSPFFVDDSQQIRD
ncbi:MAG: hypothetical protein Q8R05_03265 [Candidatus Omnitrophota bacterium]|nr:hypothetical protein [Candidatus Omnitrophota bacterium]